MKSAVNLDAIAVGFGQINTRELRMLDEWRGRGGRGIGHGMPCPYCGIL
jgi:hypothetical protein